MWSSPLPQNLHRENTIISYMKAQLQRYKHLRLGIHSLLSASTDSSFPSIKMSLCRRGNRTWERALINLGSWLFSSSMGVITDSQRLEIPCVYEWADRVHLVVLPCLIVCITTILLSRTLRVESSQHLRVDFVVSISEDDDAAWVHIYI